MHQSPACSHPPRSASLQAVAALTNERRAAARRRYLQVLTWAFTLFSSVRVLSYLPTLWALLESGQSEQHSLWAWGMWACSNATMTAWLYEEAGQCWSRAVAVNALNTSMSAAVFVVIAALRV